MYESGKGRDLVVKERRELTVWGKRELCMSEGTYGWLSGGG